MAYETDGIQERGSGGFNDVGPVERAGRQCDAGICGGLVCAKVGKSKRLRGVHDLRKHCMIDTRLMENMPQGQKLFILLALRA
jgi:hypothetical protein